MTDNVLPRVQRILASETTNLVDSLRAYFERPDSGLLIDLDGTLVHSEAANQSALRQYFLQRGWNVPDGLVRAFSGRRALEVFATVAGPWGDEDPLVLTQEVQHLLATMEVRPEPVAGAKLLLAVCASTCLPVAVVTSATREWTVSVLRSLNVEAGAIAMVTGEDCALGKPDPEPFRRGAELLGLDPSGLVAIEDSPAGVAAARASGTGLVVGVTTSESADHLLSAGAHRTAADLRGLAAAVASRRTSRSGPQRDAGACE